MAQDRYINITLDPNVATKLDIQTHRHSVALAAAGASDLTLSFDSSKFASLNVLRSAAMAAVAQAAGAIKP